MGFMEDQAKDRGRESRVNQPKLPRRGPIGEEGKYGRKQIDKGTEEERNK